MEDKTEELIKQYPIHVNGKRRIRGAILFETKEGIYTLIHCKESEKRLAFTEEIKKNLERQGRMAVDSILKTTNGEYTTRDKQGNIWILKRWFLGRECNLRDAGDVKETVQNLAKLHQELFLTTELPMEELAKEEERVEMLADFQRLGAKKEIFGTLQRHMREMKRVYNYIRTKKQRNEMEISILNLFPQYYEQAQEALAEMEKEMYQNLQKQSIQKGMIYHGSYSYHNVLFTEKEVATVNFERAEFGMQIMDLYHFLRKLMEKSGWNVSAGMEMLEEYQRIRPLEGTESKMLYLLFLFPEKFWKQIDFYYNGKKSWMSLKNYDKLCKIQIQETARRNFLKEVKGLLF